MRRLRKLLPSPDVLRRSRWLRWLGPALFHPALWHLRRRSLALGIALGVFFGLLVPIAQIPLSVGAAVVLRANVPSAVASTLVTNPLTFGPIYYFAWRLGSFVLREPPVPPGAALPVAPVPASGIEARPGESWWQATQRRIRQFGKPLLLGLALMAVAFGLLAYYAVLWIWAANTWIARRYQGHRERRAAKRQRNQAD